VTVLRRIGFTAAAAATLTALFSAAAPAAVTVTSYKITSNLPPAPTTPADGPSTLQAGANPDAGSFSAFGYPNATEDLRTAITNFAPGLLGNPEATPKCPQAALELGGAACPAGSAIGSSRLDTRVALSGGAGPSLAGVVYNAEPLGNEPGRLGVVTPLGGGAFLVSSIPFEITPRGSSDYGLTGTLTDINRLPMPPFPADLQVAALGFVINGSSRFVRNPTSCMSHTSTGQAIGYDDSTVSASPPHTFTTAGCDSVAFAPQVSIEVGDRATTRAGRRPPLVVKITQAAGQADLRNAKITLPPELNTNNAAYKLCTEAQAAAEACPATSQFGGVQAQSPFLRDPLKGPVHLLQQVGRPLPGLLLDLKGRAHVHVQTTTQLVNNRQIQSFATDSPQLPISELRIGLNGGRDTGVFTNRTDLCFRGSSRSKFNPVVAWAKLEGWNGKSTGDVKLAVKVNGCGPGVTGRVARPTSSRPRLSLTVQKHPDAPNMKELTVTFGRNLALFRNRLASGGSAVASADGATVTYVSHRTLKLSGLPSAGAARVAIRLRKGAVRISPRSRRLARRGRSVKFRVKVAQDPVTGSTTSTRASFRAKRKRR
jgi:hypothetical protein